tara:strand:+ start:373 stop:582 length:210 start_codon:yes stop_codon:yes gene_type:complete
MSYRYNIKYVYKDKPTVKNFKNKDSMLKFLEKSASKLHKYTKVYINFASVSLPFKHTTWFGVEKTEEVV